MSSAIKNLPDNVSASIVGGVITLTAGALRSTTGLVQDSTIQQEFAANRKIETWRQNYGERINKLAQAISNTSTDGDADAALTSLAQDFGLIDSISNTDEPSNAEQLAAEIAVEQGWYPDVKAALAGTPDE